MADFLDAAELIQDRLRAAWTATPAARLRFENDPYVDMTDLAPFCQVEIVGGPDSAYMGETRNRLSRADGVVMLHFMTPILDGREARRAMHRNARAALVNATWKRTAFTVELEWEDDDWWDGRDVLWIYMQGISATMRGPSDEDGSYFGATSSIAFYALYRDTP